MAKQTYKNDSQAVTEFIQKLPTDFANLINEIRKFILSLDSQIGEHIKWNSPSFFFLGEMKPFDPKTYKRDLLVIHTRKNIALLVFPNGMTLDNSSGILEGNYEDGRRMITFNNLEEFEKKKTDLQMVITELVEISKDIDSVINEIFNPKKD